MVATPRHVVVAIPVAAADVERKGEEPREGVDRAPRVDANRNCCRVGLDVAGSASLRRKTAAAATMVKMKIIVYCRTPCVRRRGRILCEAQSHS
jgi:hypothetical protein